MGGRGGGGEKDEICLSLEVVQKFCLARLPEKVWRDEITDGRSVGIAITKTRLTAMF